MVPSRYVGTSMGSVVAACFASGLSYPEVLKRLTAVTRRDVAALSPAALLGLFGQLVLFGAGGRGRVPLHDALYASCALPLYYPAGMVGDRRYLDGGLRAVLPLDVAAAFDPELVYAVMVGPSVFDIPIQNGARVPAMLRVHNTAMRILMAAQTEAVLARWKRAAVPLILVQPRLDQEATFAVDSAVHYVEEGYRAASRALNEWEAGG
jgi:NTE family protein